MFEPGSRKSEAPSSLFGERIPLGRRTMREHTAAGTLVNGAFQVGLVTLALLKGLVVAAFLDASEYGVWGILLISLTTITWLRQVGVGDKFVQQEEEDQELAWQKAFTLELLFSGAFVLVFAAAVPIMSLVYGRSELLAPGFVIALTFSLGVFQASAWIFYRRMEFAKQRALLSIEPAVGFLATLVLAAGGAGYWSLVLGALMGTVVGSIAAVLASPYRFRLRYRRGTAREYVGFSAPLLLATASSVVIAQGSIIAGEAVAGLAGVGAITLAATIAHYSDRVDAIVTATLYPAICAVKDRKDLLFESFVKSNRLTLMWGVPFGVGLSLFASDLVKFGLGEDWEEAIVCCRYSGSRPRLGTSASTGTRSTAPEATPARSPSGAP